MNICVFGGGGKTGVEIVKYAQSKGHHVTAHIHSPQSAKRLASDTEIVQGDVMHYDSVFRAVEKADAVISVLGHTKDTALSMQTVGIQNIILAMHQRGIKRIVSLTGTGAREPGDAPSLIDRILNPLVWMVAPARMRDGVDHVKPLKHSNLDWTVVRVLSLNSLQQEVSGYTLTTTGPAELTTSRKKVAKVMVELIDDEEYIGKLPVISG